MKTRLLAGAVTFSAFVWALPAMAAVSDQSFATQAAQDGVAEVQMGQLALEKGEAQGVKQFGQMLVQDHTQANQQLLQIAQQQKVTVPQRPTQQDVSEMDKLKGLSGADFDRQFARVMVQDHQKSVQLFQQEAQSGHDSALKSFAQNTLPVLQKHLQTAESLEQEH